MNFDIPQDIRDFLKEVDDFIEDKIKPLEQADDNIRFFDHRRENARTDWDNQGLPNEDWEALLAKANNWPLRLASSATPSRRNTAAAMAITWAWPSSGSTWRPKGAWAPQRPAKRALCCRQQYQPVTDAQYGTEEQKAQWLDG